MMPRNRESFPSNGIRTIGFEGDFLTPSESSPRSGLRVWLQEHQAVSITLALLVTALSIAYLVFHAKPHEEATFDFIDEETGKPSVHSIDEIPPLIGPGGKPSIVRAIFTGGKDSDKRTLMYLEKYSPEAKAYMEEYHRSKMKGPPNVPGPLTAVWVRLPKEGSPWVTRDSAEGQAIVLNTRR